MDIVYKKICHYRIGMDLRNIKIENSVDDENARTRNCGNAIEFLNESMIVNNCVNVTKSEVALEMYANRTMERFYRLGRLGTIG